MFMVYWCEVDENGYTPQSQHFDNDMTAALALTEILRKRQAAGEGVGFVTLASENPNSVGKMGASDVTPDYSWTKRREPRDLAGNTIQDAEAERIRRF